MKTVYLLQTELGRDPEQVSMAQQLTLDPSRPRAGLKGSKGLFASEEWWDAITRGAMQTRCLTGRISRLYVTGMERGIAPNTVEIVDDNGVSHDESIYANSRADRREYQEGRWVEIVYALDELKAGGISAIPLEVRIGTRSRSRHVKYSRWIFGAGRRSTFPPGLAVRLGKRGAR